MKKNFFSGIVCFILIFNVTAYANESSMNVLEGTFENLVIEDASGKAISNVTAISYNNNLYFSLIEISNKLNKNVIWDKKSNTIDIIDFSQHDLEKGNNVVVSDSKLDIKGELITFHDDVFAEGAIVIEDTIDNIMFEKNGYSKLYPASTVKIMTALLALEKGNLQDEITVSSNVTKLPADSRKAHIMPGDRLTLEQLLYGMLLYSGNDCALAIAEHIGKSEANFADMMNKKAKEIGALDTNFVNSHGYHDSNQYTTPRDLALITIEASKYPEFIKIIKTPYYKAVFKNRNGETKEKDWKTTNLFLRKDYDFVLKGIIGGKTGYTSASRHNLVTLSKYNGHNYYCVTLKDSPNQRYRDTKKLLENSYDLRAKEELKKRRIIKKINIHPIIKINNMKVKLNRDTFMAYDEIYTSLDNINNIFKENKISLIEKSIKVFIDKKQMNFREIKPIIYKGKSMVSVKEIANEFNLRLSWNDTNKRVTLYGNNINIEIPINDKVVTKNNEKIEMKQSTIVLGGHIFVPIDFIANCLGKEVDWGIIKAIKIDAGPVNQYKDIINWNKYRADRKYKIEPLIFFILIF